MTVGPPNWENGTRRTVVRIERPVPTTDEPPEADATPDEAFELGEVHGYDKGYADGLVASPHPPTREQIAEAIYTVRAGSNQNWHRAAFRDDYLKEADAVLALLQKGADQ